MSSANPSANSPANPSADPPATSSGRSRAPVPALPGGTLAALALAAFATVSTELTPTGLLPDIAADLGVGTASAGALVAVWALTVAAGSLLLVRLTRRWPRRWVLVVALLVCAGASLLTALAPVFAVAVLGRVVGAAAHGVFWSLLVPHVAALVPAQRLGRAVALVLAGPTAAGIVGVPLGAEIGTRAGWRAVLVGLALLTAATALVLLRTSASADGARDATAPGGRRGPAFGRVLGTAASTAAVLAGHFAAFTFVAVLVGEAAGLPPADRGRVLLLLGLAGAAGLALSGRLSDRAPLAALPLAAGAFVPGLGALLLLGTHPVASLAALACWGFLVGLLPPVFQTRLVRLAGEQGRDVAGAVAVTAFNIGIAAGAAAGGLVLAAGGWRALVLLAAACAAAGALGVLRWSGPRGG